MRKVIRQVHINMPWRHLPRHLGMVLEHGFHLEIGLGGMDVDDLSKVAEKHDVEEVFITIPSATGVQIRRIIVAIPPANPKKADAKKG